MRLHLNHLPSEDAPSSPPPASIKLDLAHAKEEEEEEEEGAFAAVTQMSQEATQMSEETDAGTQLRQESNHETRVARDLPTITPTVPRDADGGGVPKVLEVSSAGSRFMVSLSVAVSVILSVAFSVAFSFISMRLYPRVGGKGANGPESMVLNAFQCISMHLHVACACRAHESMHLNVACALR